MVADMGADMEVHMVADMEVDKVADMMADMFADIVTKLDTLLLLAKLGAPHWLIGPKLFRPRAISDLRVLMLSDFI